MGDRANVYIREDETHGVYLYTHWCGHDLPETVRAALASDAGRSRENDSAYLARIIFCHMVPPQSWSCDSGYGISASLGDNEHPIIVVDPHTQRIGFAEEPDNGAFPTPAKWESFEMYRSRQTADWPERLL